MVYQITRSDMNDETDGIDSAYMKRDIQTVHIGQNVYEEWCILIGILYRKLLVYLGISRYLIDG